MAILKNNCFVCSCRVKKKEWKKKNAGPFSITHPQFRLKYFDFRIFDEDLFILDTFTRLFIFSSQTIHANRCFMEFVKGRARCNSMMPFKQVKITDMQMPNIIVCFPPFGIVFSSLYFVAENSSSDIINYLIVVLVLVTHRIGISTQIHKIVCIAHIQNNEADEKLQFARSN